MNLIDISKAALQIELLYKFKVQLLRVNFKIAQPDSISDNVELKVQSELLFCLSNSTY